MDERQPVLIAVVGAESTTDVAFAQPLADDLDRAIDSGATMLVVDLGRAATVGTCCLNALLRARSRLLAREGRVAMVLPPRLRRLFGLLGLDRRFVLAADRLQAMELLGVTTASRPGTLSPAPRARAA
jgi:anti-anti-sigma regulatory factor